MLRVLFYLLLGWGIYYAISGLLSSAKRPPGAGGENGEEWDDVMVACPECGTYFPSRIGTPKRVGGHKLLFCCVDCAQRYAQRGGAPAGGQS